MTIGDVLAVIGTLTGLGACSWAVMMGVAMLFPGKCESARSLIENSHKASFAYGAILMMTLGLLSFLMLAGPIAGSKMIGWVLLVLLLATAAVGAGGVAMLGSQRIRQMDPTMSEYQALSRGAAITFLIGLTPLLGWFFVAPLLITLSLGTGARVLFSREKSLQAAA